MRAAVYCPGPSFRERPALVPAGVHIGVNETVEVLPVDWWVFADPHVPLSFTPCGPLRGVCCLTGRSVSDVRSMFRVEQVLRWSEIERYEWLHYSVLAALALAKHIGAKEIVLVGADMSGDEGPHRSASRWGRERVYVADYCRHLAGDGIRVTRVTKEGEVDGCLADRVR